jgi:hypothetical protein
MTSSWTITPIDFTLCRIKIMCELTIPKVGDPIVIPDPLAQFDTPFETFMGDGVYDREPVSEAVLNKQPNAQVVVPPQQDGFVVGGFLHQTGWTCPAKIYAAIRWKIDL